MTNKGECSQCRTRKKLYAQSATRYQIMNVSAGVICGKCDMLPGKRQPLWAVRRQFEAQKLSPQMLSFQRHSYLQNQNDAPAGACVSQSHRLTFPSSPNISPNDNDSSCGARLSRYLSILLSRLQHRAFPYLLSFRPPCLTLGFSPCRLHSTTVKVSPTASHGMSSSKNKQTEKIATYNVDPFTPTSRVPRYDLRYHSPCSSAQLLKA